MKKFIALAALVLVSMVTTTMYAQESSTQRRADRKAQRDAERARLKAEQQAADAVSYDDAVAALGISAQIFLTLTNGDNNATVTINPNFNSNTMTLSGSLLPLNQSNIFKGRSW